MIGKEKEYAYETQTDFFSDNFDLLLARPMGVKLKDKKNHLYKIIYEKRNIPILILQSRKLKFMKSQKLRDDKPRLIYMQ